MTQTLPSQTAPGATAAAIRERLVAAGLDPDYVRRVAVMTVEEDLAGGVDATSVATVPADARCTADFTARAGPAWRPGSRWPRP